MIDDCAAIASNTAASHASGIDEKLSYYRMMMLTACAASSAIGNNQALKDGFSCRKRYSYSECMIYAYPSLFISVTTQFDVSCCSLGKHSDPDVLLYDDAVVPSMTDDVFHDSTPHASCVICSMPYDASAAMSECCDPPWVRRVVAYLHFSCYHGLIIYRQIIACLYCRFAVITSVVEARGHQDMAKATKCC